MKEEVVMLTLAEEVLPAILHQPGGEARSHGVLIIVGGPQYRVGSHRQFVLLARQLAAEGFYVMRFDVRGMGDASGRLHYFDEIQPDIATAVQQMYEHCSGLSSVVLWGLCDGASAALDYAWRDPRVSGVVLLNPWVRTPEGKARAYLKHYYLQRLFSRSFWTKLVSGQVAITDSLVSLMTMLRKAVHYRPAQTTADNKTIAGNTERSVPYLLPPLDDMLPLPQRMAAALSRFQGKVLLILSGNDLTAQEFCAATQASSQWQTLLRAPRVEQRTLTAANHTFSSRAWRDQVAQWTSDWLIQVVSPVSVSVSEKASQSLDDTHR